MGVGVEDAGRSEVAVTTATSADPGDEFTTSAYSSLTYDDGAEAEISLWHWRWQGRILTLRVPCGLVYIGPHWYCSVVMLCFILGVGIFYCCSAASNGPWQLLGGTTVTLLSTVTFLRCALANPGILKPQAEDCAVAAEDAPVMPGSPGVFGAKRRRAPMADGRRCNICNLVQPSGCSHCEFCQVCIEGFDHHCPWMGKCIGKSNLCSFYTFICVSMSSLAYIFVLTVLCTPQNRHDTKPGSIP